jgi:hypothetical protein
MLIAREEAERQNVLRRLSAIKRRNAPSDKIISYGDLCYVYRDKGDYKGSKAGYTGLYIFVGKESSANARRRASRTTSRRRNYSYGRATLRHSRVRVATKQLSYRNYRQGNEQDNVQGNTEEDEVQGNTKEDDAQDIDDK